MNAISRRISSLAVTVLVVALFAHPAIAQVRLDLVGHPDGKISRVLGLSYDGRAASGLIDPYHSGSTITPGFRWERDVGRVDFPIESPGVGISGDGRIVVGHALVPGQQGYRRLFDGTIQGTGLVPGYAISAANATNYDGSVVVGFGSNLAGDIQEPFRWTPTTGIRKLTGSPGGYGQARGVSDDGNTVVGTIDPGTVLNPPRAFVWTEATKFTYLQNTDGRIDNMEAFAISGNGHFVVGDNISQALLWDNGVPLVLSGLPGSSTARDVSDDGRVVLGNYGGFDKNFIWTPTLGMMDARVYLEGKGIVFPSGTIGVNLSCVSGDGLSFGGSLVASSLPDENSGFIATIPSPGGIVLLISFTGFMHRRRHASHLIHEHL